MMKSDERFLKDTYGQQRPFKVPDGYFEDFVARMDTMLPDKEVSAKTLSMEAARPKAKQVWLKVAAAACVCGLLFGAIAFIGNTTDHDSRTTADASAGLSTASVQMTAVDYMADYGMLDNNDIYAYVSSN